MSYHSDEHNQGRHWMGDATCPFCLADPGYRTHLRHLAEGDGTWRSRGSASSGPADFTCITCGWILHTPGTCLAETDNACCYQARGHPGDHIFETDAQLRANPNLAAILDLLEDSE